MKKVFGTLTFGLLIIIGCQNLKPTATDKKVKADSLVARQSDTLLIADIDKISDPFMFGEKPLSNLVGNGLTPTFKEVTIHTDSGLNEAGDFVQRTLGRVYRLKYGDDYLQFYQTMDSIDDLLTAEITTNQFSNKWDAKIGMTKEEIIKRLNQFKIDSIPTTLIIGNLEYNFIQFDFDKNRLKKISYHLYVD